MNFGKQTFYEGPAHVPFLLRLPRNHPADSPGKTLDAPVCLADILPTFLGLAGQEPPDGIDGQDMVDLIRAPVGGPDGRPAKWREFLCCQCDENYMLTDGRIKYLWYKWGGAEQLFDLSADPNEERNLIEEASARDWTALWRQRMITWLAEIGDAGSDGKRLVPIERKMESDNLLRARNSLGMVERFRHPYHPEEVRLLH
jgi:arylsulfatase A-like enzyme